MDASDLITALQNTLRGGGRPHMGPGRVGAIAAVSLGTAFARGGTMIAAFG